MQSAVTTITKRPAKTGTKCPCKGCGHNVNDSHRVDYRHHDTEIGCKAKQRRGHKDLVTVKPIDITKEGCRHRL